MTSCGLRLVDDDCYNPDLLAQGTNKDLTISETVPLIVNTSSR